jgi:mono/diheme cytochrome c family protein
MRKIVWRGGLFGWVLLLGGLGLAACGTSAKSGEGSKPAPAALRPDGLTEFEFEHGIGPVKAALPMTPAVDAAMVDAGGKVFEQKCAACHKLGERYVGPALGGVTTRRTPTFVMNMILNPQGMVEKHPVTRKIFAEYLLAMPNQNLSHDEARQVVEYLRAQK